VANGFAPDDRMALGKALMLSGPEWSGILRLDGAQRRSFEEALFERSAKAQERSEALLLDSEGEPAGNNASIGSFSEMEE
jgi:hypothetical protein